MDRVNFDTWWSDFLAAPQVRGAKDGGYSAVEDIRRYVAAMSPNLRSEFVNELARIACAQSEGWSLAISSLEKTQDAKAFARIARHVLELKASTSFDSQSALGASLRVLAGSADPAHRRLLEEYLLEAPVGLYWTSVPWAVWPGDRDLFGRAWARYFSTVPVPNWRDTAIVQAFLSKPEALACVRDALRVTNGAAWTVLRAAIVSHSDAPWLSRDQCERVKLVCEDAC